MPIAAFRPMTRRVRDGVRVPLSLRLARRVRWTAAVIAVVAGFALLAPAPAGAQTTVWSATLTVDEAASTFGCGPTGIDRCSAALTSNSFTFGGTTYTIQSIRRFGTIFQFALDKVMPSAIRSSGTLTVGGSTSLSLSSALSVFDNWGAQWSNPGFTWTDNQSVSLSLTVTPPAHSITIPANGATGVHPTTRMWFYFDKPVRPASNASVTISAPGTTTLRYPLTSGNVNFTEHGGNFGTGGIVKIVPNIADHLQPNKTYTVTLPGSGAIEGLNGVAVSSSKSITFTTAAMLAPASLVPKHGSVVATSSDLALNFNHDVIKGTGYIYVHSLQPAPNSGKTLVEAISTTSGKFPGFTPHKIWMPVSDSRVSISGKSVTVDLPALTAGHLYNVKIPVNAFIGGGQSWSGFPSNGRWLFATDGPGVNVGAGSNSGPGAPTAPPDAVDPSSIRVVHNGGSLTAVWAAPEGAETYDVTYQGNGVDARAAWDRPGTELTISCDVRPDYQDQHCVTGAAEYTVGVRARNGLGESAWTYSAAPAKLAAPDAVDATSIGVVHNGGFLTVTWDAPARAATYDVTYQGNGVDARAAWDRAGTSLTITCDSRWPDEKRDCVSPEHEYRVGIRARNAGGESEWVYSGRQGRGNTAPAFTGAAAIEMAENQAAAGTVAASDAEPEDNPATFALAGGVDAAEFAIDAASGALSFKDAPDYEFPRDGSAGGSEVANDNVYHVTVRATTGAGAWRRTADRALTVKVSNADEDPVGLPAISGAARVGQTLTADASGIADPDGLSSPGWSWQWIRVDGGTETDIDGATSSSYTPVSADAGRTLKARVDFTDDGGFAERLTSAETAAVAAAAALAAPDASAEPGDRKVTLRWAAVERATKYQYRMKTAPAAFGDWASAGGASATSKTVTGLDNGTQYVFEMRAGEGGAPQDTWSAASAPAAATPNAPPARAEIFSAWPDGGRILVMVIPVADATGYEVRMKGAADGPWTAAPHSYDAPNDWDVIALTGLAAGEHSFQVRAVADGVPGPASAVWTETLEGPTPAPDAGAPGAGTPQDPAEPPDAVDAASIGVVHNGSSLSVSWTAPDGATHYDVTYQGNGVDSRAAWNRAGTSLTITCDIREGYDNCVSAQHGYTVGLRARNAAGESGWVYSGTPATRAARADVTPVPALPLGGTLLLAVLLLLAGGRGGRLAGKAR